MNNDQHPKSTMFSIILTSLLSKQDPLFMSQCSSTGIFVNKASSSAWSSSVKKLSVVTCYNMPYMTNLPAPSTDI